MRVPVTIWTPENKSFNLYYDTILCSFYNEDGSLVELPTNVWKRAAESLMRILGYRADFVVTIPESILIQIMFAHTQP